ncbi:MAG: homoserine dehydrogenase [Oscillospiraceae bacterium]|jgi:homoserine dehydrogenase|nr:homoserine dehydrogenase [Oscillospiraceae bacterium]
MSYAAVLGYGTVGSGTVEFFRKNKAAIEKRAGQPFNIKYVLDTRDLRGTEAESLAVTDFSVIENDPEVTVVAEVIGGATFAYDFAKRAIKAGKSLITSNKELVATKGAELLKLANENGVHFSFEASVGGGIPVIRPIKQCLSTDVLQSVSGILNGTTNYILTRMENDSITFQQALKQAQDLGYAERDPSADVLGHDTCRKICILASLAFGRQVYPESVSTAGIDKITLDDIRQADKDGYKIKLLGAAKRVEDGVSVITAPFLVPKSNQLANVGDVFNAVLLEGESTGDVMFYGRGAGKMPTASAVASDMVNAVKTNADRSAPLPWVDSGSQAFVKPWQSGTSGNILTLE